MFPLSLPFALDEQTAGYCVTRTLTEADIINAAKDILSWRVHRPNLLCNPQDVTDYLITQFEGFEYEVFACLFLDNRHRLIEYCELFRGSIDGCSVFPREVVKAALSKNSAAVIFAHNHPSGIAEPSRSDISITKRLKDALALVDIRVLDHIIIGGIEKVSLAERGLM